MKKPCATCPFLEANRGKPTPTDFKCTEQNETDWYSQENINGIWQVMRMLPASFLSCHSTDPDYYGADGKPIYACLGATLAAIIHIKIFSALHADHNAYVALVGPDIAMSSVAMLGKSMAILNGKTDPNWADMKVASVILVDLQEMRFPDGFDKLIKRFKLHVTK